MPSLVSVFPISEQFKFSFFGSTTGAFYLAITIKTMNFNSFLYV